jgi:hypothetical protein
MIRTGSTITLEAWDMKYKPNSDWNHAWGAAPANIISRQMWGIKPIAPGFAKAQIKPQLSPLTSSEITVPTIKGKIRGSYKKELDGREEYHFTIPEEMTAELSLKTNLQKKISVNGKKIKNGSSISLVGGDYTIKIR